MGCNHDCSSCSSACGEEKDLHEKLNEFSSVGKVIAVVSGKGGVGQSMVTSMLAVTLRRKGKKVAILDADITGPSIPKAFGISKKCVGNELGILPAITETGIEMISGTVKQFWSDVLWNDVDYMLVDMPPGTGDVPLTVFQSIPVDGIIVVASPQELVGMIVEKAVKMAQMMDIPILGLVENMSYFCCTECGKRHAVFGDSHIEDIAERYDTKVLAKLPIDPDLAAKVDAGKVEMFEGSYLDGFFEN